MSNYNILAERNQAFSAEPVRDRLGPLPPARTFFHVKLKPNNDTDDLPEKASSSQKDLELKNFVLISLRRDVYNKVFVGEEGKKKNNSEYVPKPSLL